MYLNLLRSFNYLNSQVQALHKNHDGYHMFPRISQATQVAASQVHQTRSKNPGGVQSTYYEVL